MVNRSQLKFHETFQPEVSYIAKILELASKSYCGNKFEISEETGIPTGKQKGKVEPHIKFANYMGLISYVCEKGNYRLKLTTLGNEIYEQDPYLHELLTKWLCHYGISRKGYGAPQWSFLVNDAHAGFIQGVSSERLLAQSRAVFEGDNMTFEEVFGVMKRSYLDGFFSELEYVNIDEDGAFKYNEILEREELLFVYAYAILSNWDEMLPDKAEITLMELLDDLSFGKIFGLNDDSISEILDELSDEDVIIVNRQLFPATIIRMTTAQEILPRLYSRLL